MTKKVLNSAQSGTVTEVKHKQEPILVADDNDGLDFLERHDGETRRPFFSSPTHEAVVEVAGVKYTPESIDLKDIPFAIPYRTDRSALSARGSDKTNNGNWRAEQNLSYDQLDFKHVKLGKIDLYITAGSEFIISEALTESHRWNEHRLVVDKELKNVLVLVGSSVKAKILTVLGTTTLRNSKITSEEGLNLIDSKIILSTVKINSGHIGIDDSELRSSYLQAGTGINISDSHLRNVELSNFENIVLERISGGNDFSINVGYKSKLSLHVENTYLHKYDYACFNTDSINGYNPVSVAPLYNLPTINVVRRIDYGTFSAGVDVKFLRVNENDILVGGKLFTIKDFFPEYIVSKEPKVVEQESYHPRPWMNVSPVGYFSRDSEVWKKAASIAFQQNKVVVGKTGEGIVLQLLEQIKSRINLYVELGTLI